MLVVGLNYRQYILITTITTQNFVESGDPKHFSAVWHVTGKHYK